VDISHCTLDDKVRRSTGISKDRTCYNNKSHLLLLYTKASITGWPQRSNIVQTTQVVQSFRYLFLHRQGSRIQQLSMNGSKISRKEQKSYYIIISKCVYRYNKTFRHLIDFHFHFTAFSNWPTSKPITPHITLCLKNNY